MSPTARAISVKSSRSRSAPAWPAFSGGHLELGHEDALLQALQGPGLDRARSLPPAARTWPRSTVISSGW